MPPVTDEARRVPAASLRAPAPSAPRPAASRRGPSLPTRARRVNWGGGAAVGVWLVIVVVPLLALVFSAFKDQNAYLDHGPLSLPTHPTLENFRAVLDGGFARYLLNTTLVTAGTVALVLALALPAAYAIVRSPHPVVGATFRLFLLGLAIPAQATIIPIYLIITRLHLYDTLVAIILPTAAFTLPLSVLVLSGTLRDIPRELYEAMSLDGASAGRMMRSLVLPMSRGGIVTVAIFTALNAWNGFLFPLILTQSQNARVLTLGLWNFQGQFGVNVPGLMAAVLLSVVPFFVVYLFARRWIIAGLAGAGGK
jgi:xylobiose transport system permease protein